MRQTALARVLLLAAVVLTASDILAQDSRISTLIDDLLKGRYGADKELRDVEDRGRVLAALQAALDDEAGTLYGKRNVIETLILLEETELARRALESSSLTTRRAAALVLYESPDLRDRIAPIVVGWLGDEQAASRGSAAWICDQLDLRQAVPELLKIVDTATDTGTELALFGSVLSALDGLEAEGLGPTVLQRARDPGRDRRLRAAAFQALGCLTDVPHDEAKRLMLDTLADTTADILLRHGVISALGRKRFADAGAFAALEKVLFDPKEANWPGDDQRKRDEHWVIQRRCLDALARNVPLDRVRALLLDKRVCEHPYFGVRTDVAAGLASMRVTGREPFDILCAYLVDEDPRDQAHLVRQEAWLTLWTLTGLAHGVPRSDRFANAPRPLDDDAVRQHIFATHHMRPGVSLEQVQIVREAVADLAAMSKARESFQAQWETIRKRWDAE